MHEDDEQQRIPAQPSPEFLRRITSLAALVADPDDVNWAILWRAWLELFQETKGSPMEIRMAQLGAFIQLKDAKGFVEKLVELAPDESDADLDD
jgi:hypothetical protein